MYRIYMPVDLVIAITHNKMRRRNAEREREREQKAEIVKRENRESREKINNSGNVKLHKCLDIFRLW
jgi:hypothetical protein